MVTQKTKILIVEDEKTLSDMYYDKFKEAGFGVDVAFSAEEAVDLLKKKKPDLVLLDILLPRKNGIGFLEEIKNISDVADIPIVGFSNYDDPETKKKAFDLGVKDYLLKTQYTPQQVLEKIKQYLETNQHEIKK